MEEVNAGHRDIEGTNAALDPSARHWVELRVDLENTAYSIEALPVQRTIRHLFIF